MDLQVSFLTNHRKLKLGQQLEVLKRPIRVSDPFSHTSPKTIDQESLKHGNGEWKKPQNN